MPSQYTGFSSDTKLIQLSYRMVRSMMCGRRLPRVVKSMVRAIWNARVVRSIGDRNRIAKMVEGMGGNRMARVAVLPLTGDSHHQCDQRKKLKFEDYV